MNRKIIFLFASMIFISFLISSFVSAGDFAVITETDYGLGIRFIGSTIHNNVKKSSTGAGGIVYSDSPFIYFKEELTESKITSFSTIGYGQDANEKVRAAFRAYNLVFREVYNRVATVEENIILTEEGKSIRGKISYPGIEIEKHADPYGTQIINQAGRIGYFLNGQIPTGASPKTFLMSNAELDIITKKITISDEGGFVALLDSSSTKYAFFDFIGPMTISYSEACFITISGKDVFEFYSLTEGDSYDFDVVVHTITPLTPFIIKIENCYEVVASHFNYESKQAVNREVNMRRRWLDWLPFIKVRTRFDLIRGFLGYLKEDVFKACAYYEDKKEYVLIKSFCDAELGIGTKITEGQVSTSNVKIISSPPSNIESLEEHREYLKNTIKVNT